MRKKILLIGMLNSIHLANWLERIADIDADIHLFPSRQYKTVHPKINDLMEIHNSISIISLLPNRKLSAYLEFILDKPIFKFFTNISRAKRLERVLNLHIFEKIHAIEIQHAGYLLTESVKSNRNFENIIVTNWGSDIFYYSQFPNDVVKIRKCLEIANFYSAECARDYALGRDYGFKGIELPIVPNSTTFPANFFNEELIYSRNRSQIIMKCYGGTFGLGELLLEIAENILERQSEFSIYAYSLTPELQIRAESLQYKFPKKFKYSTIKAPISHKQIIQEFKKSRVYMGASRSDGISTSFLEAIATGAYPIQTSTSCASEWIEAGAKGVIVLPTIEDIQRGLEEVLMDITTLEEAQRANSIIAKSRLSFEAISEITKTFYF